MIRMDLIFCSTVVFQNCQIYCFLDILKVKVVWKISAIKKLFFGKTKPVFL